MNLSEMIDELEWFKLDTDKRTCRLPVSLSLPPLPSAYLGKFPVREEFEPKAERQSPMGFLSCFCPQSAKVYPS